MSFLKKLLGTEPMSDEQKLERERAANEKKEKQQEERERRISERKQQQQEKDEKNRAQQEKYFGKAGFLNSMSLMSLSRTINYFEEFILVEGEEVLAGISAEYDKTKKREIKGMLIATNLQLHFVSNGVGSGQFHETFDYTKMNGIALAPDGFLSKELLIDIVPVKLKTPPPLPLLRLTEQLFSVRFAVAPAL